MIKQSTYLAKIYIATTTKECLVLKKKIHFGFPFQPICHPKNYSIILEIPESRKKNIAATTIRSMSVTTVKKKRSMVCETTLLSLCFFTTHS